MIRDIRRLALLCCTVSIALLCGNGAAPAQTWAPVGGSAEVTIDADHPPVVALTFDDGPRRSTTTRLLDGLALREVTATFFLVGTQMAGNDALIRRMEEEGHQIGVHSMDHQQLTGLNQADYDLQVHKPRAILSSVLGSGQQFWLRPPYGIIDDSVVKRSDGPIVLWSLDPEDWKDNDVQRIVGYVLSRVKDGDIILLHDIYDSTVDAALQIVDALLDRGYTFATVEELMAYRGVDPQTGKVYTRLR